MKLFRNKIGNLRRLQTQGYRYITSVIGNHKASTYYHAPVEINWIIDNDGEWPAHTTRFGLKKSEIDWSITILKKHIRLRRPEMRLDIPDLDLSEIFKH